VVVGSVYSVVGVVLEAGAVAPAGKGRP